MLTLWLLLLFYQPLNVAIPLGRYDTESACAAAQLIVQNKNTECIGVNYLPGSPEEDRIRHKFF